MVKVKNEGAHKPNLIRLSVNAKCHHGIRHPKFLISKFKSRQHKPVKRCTVPKGPKISTAVLSKIQAIAHNAKSMASTAKDLCKCQENSFGPDDFETFSTPQMDYGSFLDDARSPHFSESDTESDSEPLYRSFDTSHSSEANKCELITAVNGRSPRRIPPAFENQDEFANQWETEDTDDGVDSSFTCDSEVTSSSPLKLVAKQMSMKCKVKRSRQNQHNSSQLSNKTRSRNGESSQLSTESEWETLTESSNKRSYIQTDSSPSKKSDTKSVTAKYRIYSANTNSFIIVLDHPSRLSLRGKIQMSLLWGCLSINGFNLRPHMGFTPIYSPATTSSVLISTYQDKTGTPATHLETKAFEEFWKSQDANAISTPHEISMIMKKTVGLQCRRLTDTACSYVERFFPKVFLIDQNVTGILSPEKADHYGCQLYNAHHSKIRCIRNSTDWKELTNNVIQFTQSEDTPPRIIVCGGKRVGKSTLCRYLLNSLLNVCDKVSFMDGDPGQSEFTPPGLVSLMEITEPCFGPAFTHLLDAKLSFFVGGTTPASSPSHYVDCIGELWKHYLKSDSKTQPLLINTMGWNTGIGVTLLMDLINIVQPTHVIQMDSDLSKTKNFAPLTLRNVSNTPGWECNFPDVKTPYAHFILMSRVCDRMDATQDATREINLLSYFSRFQESSTFQPLNQLKTFKIPWSTVALHICQTTVLNSQILYIYNASVVALCRVDDNKITSSVDPTLPNFLREIPVCNFLGYGVIRGISMEEKCFHVITFLDSETLKQVNALLKGTIDMPKAVLLEQDVGGPIPYLIKRNVTSSLMIGHKPIPRRDFIGKGKKASPKKKNYDSPNFMPLMNEPFIPPLCN